MRPTLIGILCLIPTLLWAQPAELSHQTPVGTIHQMVLVPAGNFWMGLADSTKERVVKQYGGKEDTPCRLFGPEDVGDAQPLRQIYLDAYYIDKYEVTNTQYAAYMQATGQPAPSAIPATGFEWTQWQGQTPPVGYENHPVQGVSWDKAQAYCAWAGLRLPTEAEWEKAARGTDQRVFPWGNEGWYANLGDQQFATAYPAKDGPERRIFSNITIDDGYAQTAPVGSYTLGASPYGVFDMAGNLAEWTADVWEADYYARMPSVNPYNSGVGQFMSLRGGSFGSICETYLFTFSRAGLLRSEGAGFRCAGNVTTSTSISPQSWGALKKLFSVDYETEVERLRLFVSPSTK